MKCESSSTVCDEFMLERSKVSSDALLSKQLDVGMKSVSETRVELACATVLMLRREVHEAITATSREVLAAGGELISYDRASYDEVQITYRVSDKEQLAAIAKRLKDGSHTSMFGKADAGPRKIKNTEQALFLYARIGTDHILFEFPLVCWLQDMANTSGECYYRCAQMLTIDMELLKRQCGRSNRFCIADGHGGITRGEDGFSRSEASSLLRLTCKVHNVAGHREDVMYMVDDAVSHMIGGTKCLSSGATMVALRREASELLAEIIQFVDREPPSKNARQLKEVLDIFCDGQDDCSKLRRVILETLVSGDVHDHTIIIVYRGACRSYEDALEKFRTNLLPAIFGTYPPYFPRHRWVGQEYSTDWYGLGFALFGLFPRSFERLMIKMKFQGWPGPDLWECGELTMAPRQLNRNILADKLQAASKRRWVPLTSTT